MKAVDRKEHARRREAYATRALYGVVAASAALVMVVAVAPLHELDLWGQLLGLTVVTVVSFGAAWLWGSSPIDITSRRARRNTTAAQV
jgi:hypothetical protein